MYAIRSYYATDGLLSLVAKPSDQTFFDGWKLNGESVASVPFVQAGDVVTAVFKKVSVPIDATKRIEAENFTSQSGVKTETCSEGGLNVGFRITSYNVCYTKLLRLDELSLIFGSIIHN